jgi:exodeoxyribonuclease-3
MRLATWNVNGLRARIDFVKIWLEEREPDVVGMQELKLTEDEFPMEVFTELGYEVLMYGQKGWNGVAVASRLPMSLVTRGLPGEEDAGARLITANVDDLAFTTVYVPNGKDTDHADFPGKLAWLEALAAHMGADRTDSAVLCGDFNVVHQHVDSWRAAAADGRVFHTPEERSRLEALMQTGFCDLFREHHGDEQKFSWWDYRGGAFHRGHGLRIDLILGTARVRERMREIVIDRDFRKKHDGLTASDHAPVILDIE